MIFKHEFLNNFVNSFLKDFIRFFLRIISGFDGVTLSNSSLIWQCINESVWLMSLSWAKSISLIVDSTNPTESRPRVAGGMAGAAGIEMGNPAAFWASIR